MNKIDLSKNQLVEGDVLVYVYNNDFQKEKRYLHSIDHGLLFPFVCFQDGVKRSDLKKNYTLYGWEKCELIEPKYKVKDFYPLVEVLKEEGYQLENRIFLSEKEEGHQLENRAFLSEREALWFSVDMFKYCGEYVKIDNSNRFRSLDDEYSFRRAWLDEVYEK